MRLQDLPQLSGQGHLLPGVPGKDWSRVLPFWGQQETPLVSTSDGELLIDWSSALEECLKLFCPILFPLSLLSQIRLVPWCAGSPCLPSPLTVHINILLYLLYMYLPLHSSIHQSILFLMLLKVNCRH